MGRMGPGLTSMAMCSRMLTRRGCPRLTSAVPAMGAWTWGQGLRNASTGRGRRERGGPRSQGDEASPRALVGVLGGSQDLRTECRVTAGGGGGGRSSPKEARGYSPLCELLLLALVRGV